MVPHRDQRLTSSQGSTSISLIDKTDVPWILSSLMKILLQAMESSVLSDWYLNDLLRDAADCTVHTYRFLLSPACITSGGRRARALTRLISVTNTLSLRPTFARTAEHLRLQFILELLSTGPSEYWDLEESALFDAFNHPIANPPPSADLQAILGHLVREEWGDRGDLLRVSALSLHPFCH